MKPIHLLSIFFVSILFVACSQRIELSGNPKATGTVTVSFGAQLSNYDALGLRAGATATELQKNIGRLSMDGIRIVLYKQDTAGNPTEVAYAFQKNSKIFRGKISGTDQVELDAATMSIKIAGLEKINIDNYTVYFFTSPSESLKVATAVGKSFSELEKSMTYDYRVVDGGVSNLGFNLYTNVDSPLKLTIEELSKNSSAVTPYPVTATKLSAVNAQVYVNFPQELTLTNLKYNPANGIVLYVDAQNKKFNLFPKYVEADFDTPLAGQSSYKIPMDPNYEGFASKSIAELGSEFVYLDKSWGTSYFFYSQQESAKENFVMPIAENTLSSTEANGKVMTRIIVGIPMEPINKDIPAESSGSKSFFMYKNEVMSLKELKLKYDNALVASPRTPIQEEIVSEVQKMNAFAQSTGTSVNGNNLILPTKCGYEGPNLKYFQNGVMYYEIQPRHFGDNNVSDREKPGRFGLVRNTLYLYNIISLSEPGVANPLVLAETKDFNYNTTTKLSFGLSLTDMSVVETDLNL